MKFVGKRIRSCAILGLSGLVRFSRLGGYLTALGALASVSVLHSVRADASEVLWNLGPEVMAYPGMPGDRIRQLHLNGARVSFRTQTIDAPLSEVLDHYETTCEARDADLSEQLSALLGKHPRAPSAPSLLRGVTTLTARRAGSGYVACLDLGPARQELSALAEGFLAFAATGDLGRAGVPRYAFAKSIQGPPRDRTFLLTMWIDAGLNLYEMFPRARADAAGRDVREVPRAPRSQRLLSAWEEEAPSGIVVYRVRTSSSDELEQFYRRELGAAGWTLVERHPSESVAIDGVRLLSAQKDGRLATILFEERDAPWRRLTILVSEAP